jgi:hypothetical protein
MTTTPTTTPTTTTDIAAWFLGRLPAEWTTAGQPEVTVDREEITVLVALAAPELGPEADEAARAEAAAGRASGFREATRAERMSIAREAEHRFDRQVAWGVRIGDRTFRFTHLAVPVMTRLRQPERLVLDTLVAGGVARSRADALAWCVRLVGQHADEWLTELRAALSDVERIRAAGPGGL